MFEATPGTSARQSRIAGLVGFQFCRPSVATNRFPNQQFITHFTFMV
jgi:hypothetical protein